MIQEQNKMKDQSEIQLLLEKLEERLERYRHDKGIYYGGYKNGIRDCIKLIEDSLTKTTE